jgi:hypothetical protein
VLLLVKSVIEERLLGQGLQDGARGIIYQGNRNV